MVNSIQKNMKFERRRKNWKCDIWLFKFEKKSFSKTNNVYWLIYNNMTSRLFVYFTKQKKNSKLFKNVFKPKMKMKIKRNTYTHYLLFISIFVIFPFLHFYIFY